MFTLSHFPNQTRRGSILSRALLIALLYHHAGLCTPPLSKREDPTAAIADTHSQSPLALANPPPSSNTLPSFDRTNFTKSLSHLLSLLPDSFQAQDLISPITSTGEAKLHELGLRTRVFRSLFAAWEAVHLVPTATGPLTRDDILQVLQAYPSIAHDLHTDTPTLMHSYETLRTFYTQLSTRLFDWTTPYFPSHATLHTQFHNGGRGLVLTAGDKQAPYVLTSLQSLRQQGCTLPVEIMYLGDDDLSEDARDALEAIPDVITRDLSLMVSDAGWTLRGWAAKPFAILLSSFREAIFIDADALFLTNPADLFHDPGYVQTGALFFRDRLLMPGEKRAWLRQVLPAPLSRAVHRSRMWTGQSIHMQESGVVVVDKWRHFVALLLVTRLNGPDRDGDKASGKVGVYDMVYGDKETFWLGWELVGDTDYAFHEGAAAVMGTAQVNRARGTGNETAEEADAGSGNPEDPRFRICAPQLLHLGTDGRPLWFNGWLLPNKYSDDPRQQPAAFEAFITEPSDATAVGAWKLQQNNVCCLAADQVGRFSAAEKTVLEGVVQIAKEVGAIGEE
ncbi:putative alpha-1,3-mannosyltransferase [Aspergillus violaceofuscus CBS 115571]|uniref:Putative alpha-1,3-mannosyltransferase n=1 Tax=Aspergillus violaceofuscus (strain CBS 115571) TaxID=1450538 RepID=A0A2V5GRU2_ASPV1|nr:putative alpha-1,3-mannosyltransferase [Aspergillus violaceofuscus CBS 115571]